MKDFKSSILGTILMVGILGTLGAATTATFTYKTPGASDTTEVVNLVYPQKVPESGSVTTSSLADGSVTPAKLSGPIPVANGGTGATTAAAARSNLGLGTVALQPKREVVTLNIGDTVVTFSTVVIEDPDMFFVYVNGLLQSSLAAVSSTTVTLNSALTQTSTVVGVKFD